MVVKGGWYNFYSGHTHTHTYRERGGEGERIELIFIEKKNLELKKTKI